MGKLAIQGGKPVRENPFPIWPPYTEKEKQLLIEVLESHNWGGYPAPNQKASEFGAAFAKHHGAKYGICAANGTVTLEVALRAAGIKAGDEVIVPPITWIATAAAAVYLNAVPVFADIRSDNATLDPKKAEEKINKKTKAIIPVHLGSSIADMDAFMALGEKYGLTIIEDCAHMHGAFWRGKGVGSIGHLGSFSFQSSKLMTSGEGGIILTSDEMLSQKCHSLVNCGRKEFGYDDFDGRLLGWNYRIGEFQAAVLIAQLEKLDERTKLRAQNAAYLTQRLREIKGLRVVEYDERVTQPGYYQYVFFYDKNEFSGLHRDKFVDALYQEGVMASGQFYTPIYRSPLFPVTADEYPMIKERYGDKITCNPVDYPVGERFANDEGVWLHYPLLMGVKEDIDDIVAAILKIQEHAADLLE